MALLFIAVDWPVCSRPGFEGLRHSWRRPFLFPPTDRRMPGRLRTVGGVLLLQVALVGFVPGALQRVYGFETVHRAPYFVALRMCGASFSTVSSRGECAPSRMR